MKKVNKFSNKDGQLEVLSFRDCFFFRFFIGESIYFFNWGGDLQTGLNMAEKRFSIQDSFGNVSKPSEYIIIDC